MELEIEMLEYIREAYEAHAAECAQVPKAILFHQGNHILVGWDEVLGLPVLPDERVAPKRCGHGQGGHCAEGDVFWDDKGRPYVLGPEAEVA
ncbi:MAG TPA: hypothetical protein VID48_16215 [Solirubrobacteraceae bacterium]